MVSMKRIAVDMDEVLADALQEHLTRYNRDHHQALTKDQVHGKRLWEVVDAEHRERLDSYVRAEDFFEELAVMEDSQDVLLKLSAHYEVFIATAAMEVPNSFAAKYRWLRRHFPFVPPSNFVFCGDKCIIDADYLIDDTVRHFKRFRGEGILFSAPHNAGITGYRRVASWREVERLFLPPEQE